MIKDLLKFKLDLEHFSKVVVPEEHAKYCKRIAIKMHQGIVAGCPDNTIGTPVDTGWARANWGVIVGYNCPTQPMGERPEEGSTPIPANTYFQPNSILTVRAIQQVRFIWVYNNVPYIEALEDGHSKKAPTGMVVNALNSVQAYADSI